MCGLAGLWRDPPGEPAEEARAVERMRDTLVARGPDDAGLWGDEAAGLWLGHRRLSILDLSPEGHQPMRSAGGRFAIAYNGEVYNFGEIRAELDRSGRAPSWRGHSDTEVLLAAIEAWGLEGALERAVGMFAFALWDREHRELALVRDRVGIKPLVYARVGRALLFASEIKALEAHPELPRDLDHGAIASSLRYNCIPAPHSVYRAVRKVLPGTILRFGAPTAEPRETLYWDAAAVASRAMSRGFEGSEEEAIDAVERQLGDAVELRTIADVPVGAFLSGGIDSSTVVALMQARSTGKVKTFSIGNERADYDESAGAAAVAHHLGTEHTSLIVTAAQALEVIPEIPQMYDEPFADSSQIPTHLVSRLARGSVTVALSGDGGDEIFGGYHRYRYVPATWRAIRAFPLVARRAASRALLSVPEARWDLLYGRTVNRIVPMQRAGQRVHKLAGVLHARDSDDLYHLVCSHWKEPRRAVVGYPPEPPRNEPSGSVGALTEHMMVTDLMTYLPDDILTKVDRASMAVSLEARVPILDHRVVELGWSLPRRFKIRGREGKRVLRKVLSRHVPPALFDRPKMGFGVPVGPWLAGPLRDWAEALLSPAALREHGVFEVSPVREAWRDHVEGRRDWQHHMWDVLSVQAWLEARR